MESTNWTGSPQGQATCSKACSCVCWGKKRCVYEPMKACPTMARYSVQRVLRENLRIRTQVRTSSGCSIRSRVVSSKGRSNGFTFYPHFVSTPLRLGLHFSMHTILLASRTSVTVSLQKVPPTIFLWFTEIEMYPASLWHNQLR